MSSGYTFGDSPVASERLRIVAETFEPHTRALLTSVAAPEPCRRILDLGCGPGHTTQLLADTFVDATITGIDASPSFIDEANHTAPARCLFVVGDVTAPIEGGPFDLVYARYLLSHLDHVPACITAWARLLAPGGVLMLEEPERIVSADPDFSRYETISTALVRRRGADLYAGPLVAATPDPPGCERIVDRVIEVDLTAGQAAAMYWRNAVAWHAEAVAEGVSSSAEIDALVTRLRARESDEERGLFDWTQRQTVFRNRG